MEIQVWTLRAEMEVRNISSHIPFHFNMFNYRPSFNQADRLRKKNIQQQRKKARFERMRKTRRKLNKEQKRKQKKQNRKGLKYLHSDD